MKHMIIMPVDCYKATSGRFAGLVVRKSSVGVETCATRDETRYIVSGFEEAAVKQAFDIHTAGKRQQYKIEEYA